MRERRECGCILLHVHTELFALRTRTFQFVPAIRKGSLELDNRRFFACDTLLRLLDMALARKQISALLTPRTARHRAARRDRISVERHDFERAGILFRNLRRAPYGVRHKRVSQKVFNDIFVIGIVFHKSFRKPHRARLFECLSDLAGVPVGTHRFDGKEGHDTAVILF